MTYDRCEELKRILDNIRYDSILDNYNPDLNDFLIALAKIEINVTKLKIELKTELEE